MFGFQKQGSADRPRWSAIPDFVGAGSVLGRGTATSDSIDALVPAGSYIMPADSAAGIGPETLADLGRSIPVRVSNGEFALPPEQVHAIGVAVLDALKQGTHEPSGHGFKPKHFADGGVVKPDFYADPDGVVRRQLAPRNSRIISTDSAGVARIANLPAVAGSRELVPEGAAQAHSQSRALVPAGRSGPPARLASPAPAGFRPDFYVYRDGATTRTNPNAPVPPSTQSSRSRGLPPPQGKLPPPAPKADRREPDYRARAEAMHRAKRDTAAFVAERAARDAKVAADTPRVGPVHSGMGLKARAPGIAAGVLAALPEAVDIYDVAADENSTGIDVATQVAEGGAKTAGAATGAMLGGKVGMGLGLLGGPAAPVTVPIGTVLGAGIGGLLGYKGTDAAIKTGRRFLGADPASPVERIKPDREPTVWLAGSPGPEPTPESPSREGLAVTDTGVAGVSRIDGLPDAPALFTDNVGRAISEAHGSSRSRNARAAQQARDGRLNTGRTSEAFGFRPQAAAASPAVYYIGGSADGTVTPGHRNFDPLAFRAAMRQREVDAQRDELDLRREDLAERREARRAEFDPNRPRLTSAQAELAEAQAAQALQVQGLAAALANETDPTRRAQLSAAMRAAQGKEPAPRNLQKVKVPTGQTDQFNTPITQEVLYDSNTGQTIVPSMPGAEQGTNLLEQARAAVARGAPLDQVNARLRAAGMPELPEAG